MGSADLQDRITDYSKKTYYRESKDGCGYRVGTGTRVISGPDSNRLWLGIFAGFSLIK